MAMTIALAGKGGVGKTTLAALLVRYLLSRNKKPVLAVDADANSNLNEVLGLKVPDTVGNAREEMKRGVPEGMTKDVFMEMKIGEALAEAEGFDLLVMGRPEGEGCYCAANTLLAEYISRLSENYPYIVLDNEAGMEHISRMNAKVIDVFLLVSDPSRRGIQAAGRISRLADDLKLVIGKRGLIVNRMKSDNPEIVEKLADEENLPLLGTIPEDSLVSDYDGEGKPTYNLPDNSVSVVSSFSVFEKILGD